LKVSGGVGIPPDEFSCVVISHEVEYFSNNGTQMKRLVGLFNSVNRKIYIPKFIFFKQWKPNEKACFNFSTV